MLLSYQVNNGTVDKQNASQTLQLNHNAKAAPSMVTAHNSTELSSQQQTS